MIEQNGYDAKDTDIQYVERDMDLNGSPEFADNWMNDGSVTGAEFRMTITCKNLVAVIKDSGSSEFGTADILVDGNVVKQLALKNDTEFDVSGYQGGTNHIVIQDNAVYMSDADCPDKLCVHTGTIHKTGETIVCLPHRVVVEITGTTDTFDVVVQ